MATNRGTKEAIQASLLPVQRPGKVYPNIQAVHNAEELRWNIN